MLWKRLPIPQKFVPHCSRDCGKYESWMCKSRSAARKDKRTYVIVGLALLMWIMFAVYTHIDIFSPHFTSNATRGNNKKMHIAYLRVPKTGSTTLYALLVRFGLKNKLKMYIPKSSTYVSQVKQKKLLHEGKVYDMYTIHTYYNSTFFTHIVPKDSALIGSVREPIQRIVSQAFHERRFGRVRDLRNLSDTDFIHEYLRNRKKYKIPNSIASYFGMEGITKKIRISQYLERLNSRLWLVLVLEKIDESLVLLKRILNWSFSDILYAPQNPGKYGEIKLSDKEKQDLHSSYMLDFEIYDYFKTELEIKIQREGNDFHGEVLHFKIILQKVEEFCNNYAGNDSKIEFPSSKWDESFVVLSSECELIFKLDETVIRNRYSNAP